MAQLPDDKINEQNMGLFLRWKAMEKEATLAKKLWLYAHDTDNETGEEE